jgi:alpha-beta hydrolase superfamily lysophospholipase
MTGLYDKVEFTSEGGTLRGRLYGVSDAGRRVPAVVMAHGFSATITMGADRYAEVFADAGLAVLLYDHRRFGSSDGLPRRAINHHASSWFDEASADQRRFLVDTLGGRRHPRSPHG